MIKNSKIIFVNEKLERAFNNLEENDSLKKFLKRAIEDIKKNAFCGTRIPKKQIPQEYIKKYKINNLWKYDLPKGWRLIYSITTPNEVELITAILDWFNHKTYERKFNYLF